MEDGILLSSTHGLLLGFILTILILAIEIFNMVTLTDLECDYLNTTTACKRLNSIVTVELISGLAYFLVLLTSNNFYLSIAGGIFFSVCLMKYLNKPKNQVHIYDSLSILNHNQLNHFLTVGMMKTIISACLFVVTLVLFLINLGS